MSEWIDVPKVAGYYWCWKKGNKKVNKGGLFVLIKQSGKLYASDGAFLWGMGEFLDCMWYGPLTPPDPPQKDRK